MKKKSKKWYKRECDHLWSKIVRLRAKDKCELCGSTQTLQAHHVFGRRAMSTRYDIENGVCLCYKCHFLEAEQNSTKFGLWIVEKRGREWFDDLNQRYNKMTKINWEATYAYLKELDEDTSN